MRPFLTKFGVLNVSRNFRLEARSLKLREASVEENCVRFTSSLCRGGFLLYFGTHASYTASFSCNYEARNIFVHGATAQHTSATGDFFVFPLLVYGKDRTGQGESRAFPIFVNICGDIDIALEKKSCRGCFDMSRHVALLVRPCTGPRVLSGRSRNTEGIYKKEQGREVSSEEPILNIFHQFFPCHCLLTQCMNKSLLGPCKHACRTALLSG